MTTKPTQPSLFDQPGPANADGLVTGRINRDLAHQAMNRHQFILHARAEAAAICMDKGSVSSDDLQAKLKLPDGVHHNVWGAVLKYPYFHKIGEVQSRRPQANARWIHQWVLNSKDTAWLR